MQSSINNSSRPTNSFEVKKKMELYFLMLLKKQSTTNQVLLVGLSKGEEAIITHQGWISYKSTRQSYEYTS